jgi:site-specific DNA-methyltransferase (adenine-specific)
MRVQANKAVEIWQPRGIVAEEIESKCIYGTKLGVLYQGDCFKILPYIRNESIDTVFADPPFNLSKEYGVNVNDNLPDKEYVNWCKAWIEHCVRVLKQGGSFFIYNIPKWNIILGNYLNECGLNFRHWIAINIKLSLPIPGRLYPSHYSLLYYSKGKPKTFRRIRTPIEAAVIAAGR